MVVYADILILINTLVDYFLILASSNILKQKTKLWRMITASLSGGISSLYIFAPKSGILPNLLYKLTVCLILTFIAFGFCSIKQFFRSSSVLLLVTLGFGGFMTALYSLIKPNNMAVVNSVVYFNISPTVLILSSVAVYLIFTVGSYLLKRSSNTARICSVFLEANSKNIEIKAILDTGNSIEDILGGCDIIIADISSVKRLFGNVDPEANQALKSRYRILPCNTVSGIGTLEGFRCDKAYIKLEDKTIHLNKPILAISKTRLTDGYDGIINPEILLQKR